MRGKGKEPMTSSSSASARSTDENFKVGVKRSARNAGLCGGPSIAGPSDRYHLNDDVDGRVPRPEEVEAPLEEQSRTPKMMGTIDDILRSLVGTQSRSRMTLHALKNVIAVVLDPSDITVAKGSRKLDCPYSMPLNPGTKTSSGRTATWLLIINHLIEYHKSIKQLLSANPDETDTRALKAKLLPPSIIDHNPTSGDVEMSQEVEETYNSRAMGKIQARLAAGIKAVGDNPRALKENFDNFTPTGVSGLADGLMIKSDMPWKDLVSRDPIFAEAFSSANIESVVRGIIDLAVKKTENIQTQSNAPQYGSDTSRTATVTKKQIKQEKDRNRIANMPSKVGSSSGSLSSESRKVVNKEIEFLNSIQQHTHAQAKATEAMAKNTEQILELVKEQNIAQASATDKLLKLLEQHTAAQVMVMEKIADNVEKLFELAGNTSDRGLMRQSVYNKAMRSARIASDDEDEE